MKLNLTSEVVTKFVDTYVILRKFAGGEPSLYWLLSSNYEDAPVTRVSLDSGVYLHAAKYDEIAFKWSSGYGIDLTDYIVDFSIPSMGYTNTDEGRAVYGSRLPRKQWKRSLSLRQMTEGVTRLASPKTSQLDVGQYFFPSYPTLGRAILDVVDGTRSSVAINKDYALGCINGTSILLLYKKDVPVGVLIKKDGEYVCRLITRSAYLWEDIEQFITCEVYINATQ